MNTDAHTIHAAVYARRWKTLAVLSLSLVIIGLDNTILNVALPSLREHFDASNSTLQWIVDSYLLVFAGLLLTMGTLGDRFGASALCWPDSGSSVQPAWRCSPPTALTT